jgi:hypothetical protein
MRKDFSKKWFDDDEPNHVKEVAKLEVAIKQLEDWISQNCK